MSWRRNILEHKEYLQIKNICFLVYSYVFLKNYMYFFYIYVFAGLVTYVLKETYAFELLCVHGGNDLA
jgi:hypothetical protein